MKTHPLITLSHTVTLFQWDLYLFFALKKGDELVGVLSIDESDLRVSLGKFLGEKMSADETERKAMVEGAVRDWVAYKNEEMKPSDVSMVLTPEQIIEYVVKELANRAHRPSRYPPRSNCRGGRQRPTRRRIARRN